MPLLYTDEKYLEMTQKVMNTFSEDFQFNREIEIYKVQFLLFILRNTVGENEVWPTDTFSYCEIDKDVFSHTPDIGCQVNIVTCLLPDDQINF